jgi:hypothetical protein
MPEVHNKLVHLPPELLPLALAGSGGSGSGSGSSSAGRAALEQAPQVRRALLAASQSCCCQVLLHVPNLWW